MMNTQLILTFKIGRKSLNQIYVSYMRPLLEYGSVVWDGCYKKLSLEKKYDKKQTDL